ncbi:MAG: AAA family ATPase, partial [Actinomycetota bacterium]
MRGEQLLADRVRLVEAAGEAAIVVMRAPSGYGKSVLAQQLTEGRTRAWVQIEEDFDEIELSRRVLEALHPFAVSADAAQAGLAAVGYALRELATRGWIVLDDVHRLDPPLAASLIETILAERPPALGVIVAGWSLPLDRLLRAEAAGEAVVFEAADLELNEAECTALLGQRAPEIRGLSGGWPLAIGMAATRLARGLEPFSGSQRSELMSVVVEPLSPEKGSSPRARRVAAIPMARGQPPLRPRISG